LAEILVWISSQLLSRVPKPDSKTIVGLPEPLIRVLNFAMGLQEKTEIRTINISNNFFIIIFLPKSTHPPTNKKPRYWANIHPSGYDAHLTSSYF